MCAGYAQPGLTEDDILLELVMFMGVVCDDITAPQLGQTGLVSSSHLTSLTFCLKLCSKLALFP